MSGVTRSELAIEGYTADVSATETTLHAIGRNYNQRDERAHQTSIIIPTADLRRVSKMLADAESAAAEMAQRLPWRMR